MKEIPKSAYKFMAKILSFFQRKNYNIFYEFDYSFGNQALRKVYTG